MTEREAAKQLAAHDRQGLCLCADCTTARAWMRDNGWRFSPEGWNGGAVWDRPPPETHCKGPRCHLIGGPCQCSCDACAEDDK